MKTKTKSGSSWRLVNGIREHSLTMGAGGLKKQSGDHKISLPFLGGITKFQVPLPRGGSQNSDGDD